MDETTPPKRLRNVSDGSDDDRGANDAMPKENNRAAAIADLVQFSSFPDYAVAQCKVPGLQGKNFYPHC